MRLAILAGLLAAAFWSEQSQAEDRVPNIVVILADDLGWTDLSGPNLGPYTSDFYETPHLDALAAGGMRFTNSYSAGSVCTPTRASLLTGRYPASVRLTNFLGKQQAHETEKLLAPQIESSLSPDQVTVAEELKAAGYATAHLGKWHLGSTRMRQGFDTSVVYTKVVKEGPWDVHRINGLTQKAVEFIEVNRDNPFFLYLAHFAPHMPATTRPDLQAKYEAKSPGQNHGNAQYAGLVEHLDASVGQVMAKLDELGLTDSTLVVFTSDNGGKLELTSNAPLRGGKIQLYEGGIRVPAIVHLPGVIEAGSINRTPITTPDFFPTFLEMVGVAGSSPEVLDGESLVPLLTQTGKLQRDAIYWHYPHYTPRYGRPTGAIRQGDWKLLEFFEDDRVELYNLARDLDETDDLAWVEADKAIELHRMLTAWRSEVAAQMPRVNPDYAIPIRLLGDLNSDGLLNSMDLAIVLNAWGQEVVINDPTGDGLMDSMDLAYVLNGWANRVTRSQPEPASFWLLAFAGLLVSGRKYRRHVA